VTLNAFHTRAQLTQKVDHRTTAETRQIGDIGAQRAAHGTKTGDIGAAWLIYEYAVDGIRG